MKNFWKWNTVMFLMQLGMGGFVFLKTGDTYLAVTVAGVTPLLYGIISVLVLEKATARIALWTGWISLGAVATMLAVSREDIGEAILNVAITSIGLVILAKSQPGTSEEPLWARLVCAVPLGIGTVLGGLLILSGKGRGQQAMV